MKCADNELNMYMNEIDSFLKGYDIQFSRDAVRDYVSNVIFNDNSVFYLFLDRWVSKRALVEGVINSRTGNCTSVFARKCKIITAQDTDISQFKNFLNVNHFYSNAKAKYYLGLMFNNTIVAVASFSASRLLPRNTQNPLEQVPKSQNPQLAQRLSGNRNERDFKNIIMVNSYEWVRYASLPNIRVVGGMGRLLKEFERTVCSHESQITGRPYEIMSYADLEFSNGNVYSTLGFSQISAREPVEFAVDKKNFERIPLSRIRIENLPESDILYRFQNLGSVKYLKPYPQSVILPR